jgi:hypothetical protein
MPRSESKGNFQDRRPQGCGRRAYTDVFTAGPGNFHPVQIGLKPETKRSEPRENLRDRRPQGCGRRAYTDVFTAGPGNFHSVQIGPKPETKRSESRDNFRYRRPQGCRRRDCKDVFTCIPEIAAWFRLALYLPRLCFWPTRWRHLLRRLRVL